MLAVALQCALLTALSALVCAVLALVREHRLTREAQLRSMPRATATSMPVLRSAATAADETETAETSSDPPSQPQEPEPRSNITEEMWEGYHRACLAKAEARSRAKAKANSQAAPTPLAPATTPKEEDDTKSAQQQEAQGSQEQWPLLECPLCDGPMNIKAARGGGKYWACHRYPAPCRGTRSVKDPSRASPVAEVRARQARQQEERETAQANP